MFLLFYERKQSCTPSNKYKESMQISEEIHKSIVLELFLKPLERDKNHLSQLKMGNVLEEWYDLEINETFQEFKKMKDFLYKKGCEIDDLKPVVFSDGTTFIQFKDNEIVIKLSEMKEAEVDGVKYKIKSYAN